METLPKPQTFENRDLFRDPHPVYLGDFVETHSGYLGRVHDCHFWCPEDDEWLASQELLGDDPMAWKQCRWVSVLVHEGGAIVVPDQLVTVIPPFKLRNDSKGLYFRD